MPKAAKKTKAQVTAALPAVTVKIDRAKVLADPVYREYLRRKCQTDLMFLGRMLGYDRINDRVHQPAADLCVQKNPDIPLEDQDALKVRLHLDPRGTFKSTFSIIDSVQWIICFFNVRICKLTATKPLATAIVGEITDHFVLARGAEPTDFQFLFPEFTIPPSAVEVGKYTAPCRTHNWREATVMAFSIETSISGWHFDVMDPDDPVDTQNSSTPQGLKKVKRNYRVNKKTLMPWGYINFKGTRYNPFDLWGEIIEQARPGKIKVMVRKALELKNGCRLEPGDFPPESEMVLLFPELLSYDFLKDEFEGDYSSFMEQYMNDAHGGHEVTFTPESILQAMIQQKDAPESGQTFISWRFAFGKFRHAAAAVGMMANGRMHIIDVNRGLYKPSGLAHAVVQLAKKHGCHNIQIEETPGARYLESAIQNYALTLNWAIVIQWQEFQEDESVRDLRMKGIEPLINSQRLLLSDSIVCLREVHKQFVNYGMMEETEIVDVISRVAASLPASIKPTEEDPEQKLAWELAVQRDMYDRTHGLGRFAPATPVEVETPAVRPNDWNLPDILGGLNG